jgi:hypothetical protein
MVMTTVLARIEPIMSDPGRFTRSAEPDPQRRQRYRSRFQNRYLKHYILVCCCTVLKGGATCSLDMDIWRLYSHLVLIRTTFFWFLKVLKLFHH